MQRKQRNGGTTQRRREEKKPERRRCVAEVWKCVAGQRAGAERRVGRRGGEAGTLTDICWHAADAGGGHSAMTSGNMAH